MILSNLGVSPGEALLAPQGSTPGAVFLSSPLTDDYSLQRAITDAFKAVLGRIPGQIRTTAAGHTYGGVSEMGLWLTRVKEAIPLERRQRSTIMDWLQEQLQALPEFGEMNAPAPSSTGASIAVAPPSSGFPSSLFLIGGLGVAAFLAFKVFGKST